MVGRSALLPTADNTRVPVTFSTSVHCYFEFLGTRKSRCHLHLLVKMVLHLIERWAPDCMFFKTESSTYCSSPLAISHYPAVPETVNPTLNSVKDY
jgi:hypothetical protein